VSSAFSGLEGVDAANGGLVVDRVGGGRQALPGGGQFISSHLACGSMSIAAEIVSQKLLLSVTQITLFTVIEKSSIAVENAKSNLPGPRASTFIFRNIRLSN
jgi:hypothetical protein